MSTDRETILKRLLRKPAAIVALSIIVLTCLVSVFAYLLAPDHTPHANRMIVELGAKPPGFKMQLLLVPKSLKPQKTAGLSEAFTGTASDMHAVPINGYWFEDEKTFKVRHYIDEGLEDTLSYELNSIVPVALQHRDNDITAKNFIRRQIEYRTFYLGTDRYGRDILSRLLVGSRVSLSVGIVAVILSLGIGILLGALAGYYGGKVDDAVMWLINMLWAIPTLLLVFAITLTIGKGFWEIFIAIGLTMWVSAARLIRGQVMVLKEMEYITAAKALGLKDGRIILRHILPNVAGPIMVIAASNFATAILIEAGLSFLGIGVQPPRPSWGLMIKEHYNFIVTNRPLLAIIPGLAIMLLVYAFNILGNALRDVLDVRG